MGELRARRLVPTGRCFCGCGRDAEIGRWFVRGHDITAGAALRALEGTGLPQRLVAAGYGPERSVVEEAVARAGWVRCAACAYAGSESGLAAHVRGGGCEGAGRAEPGRPPATGVAVTDAADEVDAGVDVGFGSEAGTAVPGGGSPGAGVLPEGAAPGQGRRPRSRRAGEEDTGPVLAGAGPATGLLLPGSADMVWKRVPLHLRVTLAGAAYRLVTPEQPVLREKKNREVRFALKAAGSKRATGRHWLVLLSSPRGSFGSARSEKADRVYEVLHQIVAEYVGPAVGNTGNTEAEEPEGVEASGVLLAAGAEGADVSVVLPAARDCVVEGALAADTEAAAAGSVVRQGTSSGEAEPTDTRPAPRVEAAAGAARGLLLPAPHDPSWATVPLPLRQSLRMTAHHLVTPAPRALKTKTHRHVLAAVRAAQRMRMTGAHWLVLLTTERKVFGSPDSTPADAFYGVLEQILAQHPPAQDNQDRREAVPEETGTG